MRVACENRRAVSAGSFRTPLAGVHRDLGAKFIDFAGWDMPIQYPTGIVAEHMAVRTACGLFDLSHMGRVYVRGTEALLLSQAAVTRDLSKLRPGEAGYTMLTNDDGNIVDDAIAYILGPEELLFVFNAANRRKDIEHFERVRLARRFEAELSDRTAETALIGLQGPTAKDALAPLCSANLSELAGYSFMKGAVAGQDCLISRTGYTGEDGFELLVAAEHAEHVWGRLIQSHVRPVPCGLGARDTLRTEAGMPLYGHELTEETDPYEAGLGWTVSLGKSSFVGREALLRKKEQRPTVRLVGLLIEEGPIARPGCPILDSDQQQIGTLTSGTFSPVLRRGIGMGYVQADRDAAEYVVEVRGRRLVATQTSLPFVPHRSIPKQRTQRRLQHLSGDAHD